MSNICLSFNGQTDKRRSLFLYKKIIIITLAILVIFFIPACEQNNLSIFPSTLLGIWNTDDSRYKNRYIEFFENRIIFGTGDIESYTLFVNTIKENSKKPTIEWTLFCEDVEGNPSAMVIFYRPATDNIPQGASIRLKNKKSIVWYKSNILAD